LLTAGSIIVRFLSLIVPAALAQEPQTRLVKTRFTLFEEAELQLLVLLNSYPLR
jgi:hypothetical protein